MVHKKAEDMQVPDALSRCENVKADVVGSPVEDNPIVQCLVRSNPFHSEVYSIQHYVIKSVTCGRSMVFSGYSSFPHQ